MKQNNPWTAAFFCAFLSGTMMISSVIAAAMDWTNPAEPAFYSFLPMCFVYVGLQMKQMQEEMQDLKQQIEAARTSTVSTPEQPQSFRQVAN